MSTRKIRYIVMKQAARTVEFHATRKNLIAHPVRLKARQELVNIVQAREIRRRFEEVLLQEPLNAKGMRQVSERMRRIAELRGLPVWVGEQAMERKDCATVRHSKDWYAEGLMLRGAQVG